MGLSSQIETGKYTDAVRFRRDWLGILPGLWLTNFAELRFGAMLGLRCLHRNDAGRINGGMVNDEIFCEDIINAPTNRQRLSLIHISEPTRP